MTDHEISQWRTEAGSENPAGPLYAGGEFAAADIVGATDASTLICTNQCGTDCSGSGLVDCC